MTNIPDNDMQAPAAWQKLLQAATQLFADFPLDESKKIMWNWFLLSVNDPHNPFHKGKERLQITELYKLLFTLLEAAHALQEEYTSGGGHPDPPAA